MSAAAIRYYATIVVDAACSDLEIVCLAVAILAAESAVIGNETGAVAMLAIHRRCPPWVNRSGVPISNSRKPRSLAELPGGCFGPF
jgi:hypothetical protein